MGNEEAKTDDNDPLVTRGMYAPESVDLTERTVDIVFATEARAIRTLPGIGRFVEQLSMTEEACDLSRLNAGAPYLNDHTGSGDARSVMGAMVKGSAYIKDKRGHVTVRFDSAENDPDADKVFRKIQGQILNTNSVGYTRQEMKRTGEKVNGLPVFLVTKWTPHEVSISPIPVDIDSNFRKLDMAEAKEAKEEIIAQDPPASEPANRSVTEVIEPKIDQDALIAEERKRSEHVRDFVGRSALTDDVKASLIARNLSVNETKILMAEELVKRSEEQPKINDSIVVGGSVEIGIDAAHRGMEDALLHRHDPSLYESTQAGELYRNMSLLDIAKESLSSHGVQVRNLTNTRVVELALRGGEHTTSDFPTLLSNIVGKSLRKAYQATEQTFRPLSRATTMPDLKEMTRTQLGEFSTTLPVKEGGEYQLGTLGEGAEKYRVFKYGRLFAVTDETIINDDMDALARVPGQMAAAIVNKESDLYWENFLDTTKVMADGKAVFHSDHNNYITGSLSVASLGLAIKQMRLQTGINGGRIGGLRPKFFIGSVAKSGEHEQFFSTQYGATKQSDINIYAGTLTRISDPRLDDHDPDAWYLSASPSVIDTTETATLAGQQGPQLSSKESFETDSRVYKVRHWFGTKTIDYRGLIKSDGQD